MVESISDARMLDSVGTDNPRDASFSASFSNDAIDSFRFQAPTAIAMEATKQRGIRMLVRMHFQPISYGFIS